MGVLSGPRCGRASDRFGLPTPPFSPGLALLRYDFANLVVLTPDSVVTDLALCSIENAKLLQLRGRKGGGLVANLEGAPQG